MLRLNVFIEVDKANVNKFVELTKELVAKSQKEDGCIAYDIFQSLTREDVYIICETWKDEATLKAHTETAHYKTILPAIENLAKLKLEKFFF